ncbi:MAG: hypothetical protein M3360_00695, partial [Actinomycetota bacterium]|nr:hypothetical protein [Actinomycetota bacterium]
DSGEEAEDETKHDLHLSLLSVTPPADATADCRTRAQYRQDRATRSVSTDGPSRAAGCKATLFVGCRRDRRSDVSRDG